jgi:replicative DNA helicase
MANQKPQVDPKMPSNVEAERSVLGSIILNNDYAMKAFSILPPEDFLLTQHRKIYLTMQSMIGANQPVDLLTLTETLSNSEELEAAGGRGYVQSIADGMPRVSNVEHYAKIVKEKALLRNIIHTANDLYKKAMSQSEAGSSIIEGAIENFLDIASDSGGSLIRSLPDVFKSAIAQIETERKNPDKFSRLNSGLSDLDDVTSGLRKKDMVVIVGPTSNGKTLLALKYAMYGSERGYRGVVFSAEMSGEQLMKRHLSSAAHVEAWKLRKPENLSESDMERMRGVSSQLGPLTIVEGDINTTNIWAIAEAKKRSEGLDFIIIDYDQLVIEAGIDPDDEEGFFRYQRKFNIQSKKMAERLDICVILLSQLRKVSGSLAKGGRPTIDDIYGDSSIRNTPDVILWVVRDFFTKGFKKEFENKMTVYVVKARNDRSGVVKLFFDFTYMQLEDKHPDESDSVEEDTRPAKPAKPKSAQTNFVLEDLDGVA